MGWQTTAPTLPSGSSYSTVSTWSVTANRYSTTGTVSIARLSENQVSIRFVLNTANGYTQPLAPPGYADFGVGSSTTSPGWGARVTITRYWVGALNSGSTVTVKAGAHDSGGSPFSHQTYLNTSATGPAYITKYTISYDGNTSTSGSVDSQTKTYGASITLQQNGYTKTGYSFQNWNTKADGTGTTYAAGDTYSGNASVTLYAQWALITYPVTFDGNGADSGSTAAQTKEFGQPLVLAQNGFVRANYTFLYWNTISDGTGTTYAAGSQYTTNAALTLYAIWKKNNIPVYVNVGGTLKQVEKAYMNVGGTIKECTVCMNVGGTIKTLV